jgi:hypothetical protein
MATSFFAFAMTDEGSTTEAVGQVVLTSTTEISIKSTIEPAGIVYTATPWQRSGAIPYNLDSWTY